MKKKIICTTGTRAEYGVLRPLLKQLQTNKKFELYLIVSGTHISKKFGMTIKEIKKDGFQIKGIVDTTPKGNSLYDMSLSVGHSIISFSKIFRKIKPDGNIIIGDRDEMLASAIASYHMGIPNIHIHGGDRSGGIDEYNRHAITKISNIHFTATENSRKRIIKMGEEPKTVYCTGALAVDEIKSNNITKKEEFEKKYNINLQSVEILLLQHPVTTQSNKSKEQIKNTLNAIKKLKKNTFAIMPNSDAGNYEIFTELKKFSKRNNYLQVFTTLPRTDYFTLLKNCKVLVGNSSSGIIEAEYFNLPVVNIGVRQQGREQNKNVINVKESTRDIVNGIQTALKNRKQKRKKIYGNGNVAKKIVDILEKIDFNSTLNKINHY